MYRYPYVSGDSFVNAELLPDHSTVPYSHPTHQGPIFAAV